MGNEIATPLQSILAQAADTPASTGETARFRKRLESAGDTRLILVDVSASMGEEIGAKRKVDLMEEALKTVLRPGVQVIAFNSAASFLAGGGITYAGLPDPSGSTAMHKAFDLAALETPRQTLVVSDGCPDDRKAALASADRLTGTIDVLYIGREDDADAIAFMRALARVGGGMVVQHDVRHSPELVAPMRRLLIGQKGGS